jgi:hypothetical protein
MFCRARESRGRSTRSLFGKKIDSFFRVKLYARETNFKQREQTMKTRLLLALVGLAIGFVLPTFAQEKEEANPFLYRASLASPQHLPSNST